MPRRYVAHLFDRPHAALERWGLAAIVVAGLGLRLWLLGAQAAVSLDSPRYVVAADSLADGRPGGELVHHGYPALIAGVSRVVPGREWPARIVSMICGLLLVPVAFSLASVVAGPRWALLAAALVALHPLLAAISGAIAPDSLFVLIVALALLMAETRKFTSGGLWLGLGYLVRPEALIVAPAVALFCGGGVRGAVAVLIGFTVIAAPYAGYLRLDRGTWELLPGDQVALEAAAVPGGTAADAAGASAPAVPDRMAALRRVAVRLLEAWPLPLILLSLGGLAVAFGSLVAPLIALAVPPLLGLGEHAAMVPPAMVALAACAAAVPVWFGRRWPRAARYAPAAGLIALVGLALCWQGSAGQETLAFARGPRELRAAGEWLRGHGRAGAAVMDRQPFVPYYARMHRVPVPDGSLDAILDQARAAGVDYLVVEDNVSGFDPRLAPLFADGTFRQRERRVRLLHEVRDAPLKGVMVFELVRGDSAAAGDSLGSGAASP